MAVRITRSGLGLAVGIIVLALLVLGGLYLVKERGEQARREEALKVAQQNLESQSENGAAVPSVDGNTDTSGTVNEDAQPSDDATNNDDVAVEGAGQGSGATAPEELPQTGGEGLSALIAVAMLTFATASYIASRRALLQAQ